MAVVVKMPQLSDTMKFGTIVAWRKNEGDEVKPGDVIAEVETDKATMEVEAFDAGVLRKQLLKEGERAPVGAGIAVIAGKDEDIEKVVKEALAEVAKLREGGAEEAGEKKEAVEKKEEPPRKKKTARPPRPAPPRPAAPPEALPATPPRPAPARAASNLRASPAAKRLAANEGVELGAVRGTGPGGRIVRADVERAIASGADRPVVFGEGPPRPVPNLLADEEVPLAGMRKTIAERMTEAKQTIPHFYLEDRARMDGVVALRERLAAKGKKVSFDAFVMVAACRALMRNPALNVTVEGTGERMKLVRHGTVDLAFAVALEDGLITPIVKSAEALSVTEMDAAVRELARRARAGELAPEEYKGGTFTVSNLGMFGLWNFQAVVNPPQGAILAVGGIRDEVVADGGAIRPAKTMGFSLSCDHRAIDGAVGAAFVRDLRNELEDPAGFPL